MTLNLPAILAEAEAFAAARSATIPGNWSLFTEAAKNSTLPAHCRALVAEVDRLMQLSRDLWASRRAMAYGPAGERQMLAENPWLSDSLKGAGR